jgi:hypothetical protein
MKKSLFIFFTFIVFIVRTSYGQLLESCDPQAPDGLSNFLNLGKALTGNHCWENKKQLLIKVSLKNDLEVCGCLNKLNPLFSSSSSVDNSFKLTEDDLKKKVKETADEFSLEQVGLTHQAFIISKGDQAFAEGVLSNTPLLRPDTGFLNSLWSNVGIVKKSTPINTQDCTERVCAINFGDSDPGKKQMEQSEKMVANALAEFKVPEKPNIEMLSPNVKYQGEQCISAREYFANKQLPLSRKISHLVRNTSVDDFNSKEWNYQILEEEYNTIMKLPLNQRLSKRQRILVLKEKLKYLNGNQMLKTFMAADSNLSDLDKNPSISDDGKKRIKSSWEKYGQGIENKKKELFKIIKSISDLKKVSPNDPEILNTYHKKIRNFFTGDNFDLLMNENVRQGHHRVNSSFLRKLQKPPLTHKQVTDKFIQESRVGDPALCTGPGLDEAKCMKIYAQYCPKILGIKEQIFDQEEDSDLADNLSEILKNDSNPDMKTNPDFKRFNDRICHTKFRKNHSDKSPPISFFDYLKHNCPNCESDPIMMDKMRKNFFNEYKISMDKNDNGFSEDLTSFLAVSKSIPRKKVIIKRNHALTLKDNAPFSQILPLRPSSPLSSNDFEQSQEAQNHSFGQLTKDSGPLAAPLPENSAISSSSNFEKFDQKKVEDLTNEERRKYLSRLEKEYEEKLRTSEKQANSSPGQDSSSVNKEITELKKEIETWKTLLSQQQNISAQQMKMLNDSMSARAQQASSNNSTPVVKKKYQDSDASVFSAPQKSASSAREGIDDLSRSLVSKENGFLERSSPKGSTTQKSLPTTVSSSSVASASSSESVAREQAKLNSRQDQFLMIESPKAIGQDVFNLPVSSEQYQNLKKDPTRLSLDTRQMELLNKNGFITIIVGAEGKPPLELRVEKVENKIVYNFKEQVLPKRAPASRVFTRDSLELQFQNQR